MKGNHRVFLGLDDGTLHFHDVGLTEAWVHMYTYIHTVDNYKPVFEHYLVAVLVYMVSKYR